LAVICNASFASKPSLARLFFNAEARETQIFASTMWRNFTADGLCALFNDPQFSSSTLELIDLRASRSTDRQSFGRNEPVTVLYFQVKKLTPVLLQV
jgi:hypothetical protein